MKIKHIPLKDLTKIIAGLVREGIIFESLPEDDRAEFYTIILSGGY